LLGAFFMEIILVILLSIITLLLVVGVVVLVKYIKVSNQSNNTINERQLEVINKLNNKIDVINQTSIHVQNESKYNELMPLIYQQINKMDNYINDFHFENQKGYHAINLVLSKIQLHQKELFNKIKFLTEEEFKANQIIETKKIITQKPVILLLNYTIQSIQSATELINSSQISADKKAFINRIYFLNFNESFYSFLKKIGEVSRKKTKPVSENQINASNILDHQIKAEKISQKTTHILDLKNNSLTKE